MTSHFMADISLTHVKIPDISIFQDKW